jgi:ankyrin repeat protein
VRSGLSVDTVVNDGFTLLMIAAGDGHKAATKRLLQLGVAVNAVNADGNTALHTACASDTPNSDDAAIVKLLLDNGADVHVFGQHDRAALHVAAELDKLQCASALIAAGADVNCTDTNGCAPLHIVTDRHHAAVVQLLLDHGAAALINSVVPVHCMFDEHCCASMTGLMMCDMADTVKALLAAGADVHVTIGAGDTCLHVAARHNCKAALVCLLIKAGADLHAVNSEGKTAAQLAHDRGHVLIEQLLIRAAQQQAH